MGGRCDVGGRCDLTVGKRCELSGGAEAFDAASTVPYIYCAVNKVRVRTCPRETSVQFQCVPPGPPPREAPPQGGPHPREVTRFAFPIPISPAACAPDPPPREAGRPTG